MSNQQTPARVSSDAEDTDMKEQGYQALSYIVTGPFLYGGLGWLGDRFFHTNFMLPIGIALGILLALYIIVKKFGSIESDAAVKSGDISTAPREESL